MMGKYCNHILRTNRRYREEEPQNIYSHTTPGRHLNKCSQLSHFLVNIIEKTERHSVTPPFTDAKL